eukprot:gene21534-27569_t
MCKALGGYKSSSFFPDYAAIEPDGNSSDYFKDRLRLYKRILSKRIKRVMKNCMVIWHVHYKSFAYQRLRTIPRRKANALFALRITMNLNKYERFSIENGMRFCLKRRLIRSYRMWVQKLSHAPALDVFRNASMLKELLLEIVFRHYLVSLAYNSLVRCVASSRCHFYRNHRLVFYVVKSIYRSLPASVVEMFDSIRDQWNPNDSMHSSYNDHNNHIYSTPLASRRDRNSSNVSPIHASRSLRFQSPSSFSGDLNSDDEYPSPAMSPYSPRSVFDTPVNEGGGARHNRSPVPRSSEKKGRIVLVVESSPEEEKEVSGGATSLSRIASLHNQIYRSSMKLLHQNLSSRQSQELQMHVATRYHHYRPLVVSLRKWMRWVPLSKLNRMDSLSAPLFYSPKTPDDRYSVPGDGHIYVYFKSIQYGFRRWRWTARRRVFLRERGRFIQSRVQKGIQSRLLGSWLICTARYEQYRRVENRVLNNRLSKQLYLSFYAWRVLLQRIQLLRNNERQRVVDRNNSIRQFVENKHKSDATRSQSSILRTWSLHIRNLKRGRMLVSKWTKTAGTRFLFLALHRWRLVCHLDTIATCFKKIWLGFKARRITHGAEYRYMRWFQPQIRKYQYFRSHHCKGLIFGILKRFVCELRFARHREVSHVDFRRAMKMLRRFKSKMKVRRRLAGRATVSRGLRCNRTVFVRLKELLIKRRALRVHTESGNRVRLKKALLRMFSTATLSTHLRMVARTSRRKLLTFAFHQFRLFHRRLVLRYRANASLVYTHQLHFHFKKLVVFNRRRQRVYSFQQTQHLKKARSLLQLWRGVVETRDYYYRLSRAHFKRFKQRSYLRLWLAVTRRRLYGQVLPGSAFQVSSRRRLLQRLMKAQLSKAFGRFRRLVYSYRKQRQSARYITTSRNNRLILGAYQKLKYHWFKKHRSLHSHRLRDVSTSVRRGLLHEALYKLMCRNLTRNHSSNLCSRALGKWQAKSRNRSKMLRLDVRCVRQFRRTMLKQYLLRLIKNVIRQKKKRHLVGLQRRQIRKHTLLSVLQKMYRRHRERVVHYNALRLFNHDRLLMLSARLLYRLRVAVRYRAKHALFRFVKRMKQMGRVFFSRLRYFVTRTKRSPARHAMIRISRKKKRLAFKRFKLRCVRMITSLQIQEHALQHHLRRKALRCLLFWRRYLFLKKRMHSIRRRFLIVPRFRAWLRLTVEQVQSDQAVRHMTHKTNLRVKKNYMYLWKLFTVRESRLNMQTALVEKLMVNKLKARVLYMWMRVIDDRVIHSKYHKVRALHVSSTLRRTFFEWHKTYLVSYLASCKTAKASLKSWYSVTFWRKRQARLTEMAIVVHDRSLARKYLLFWLYEARNMLILRRRMTVRRMKSTVKKYLRWFRRWQWRVSVIAYSSKYHCYPHHKNSIVFSKYRALHKWLRFAKRHRHHKRIRKLTTNLTAWRRLTHTLKFAREAFVNRLSAFKRKHTLAYCFTTLLSSCKELQTQRMLCNFMALMQQSRVFDFWKRMLQQRLAEKMKVANSMRGIYKVQKFHMFRVWKVKVIHAYKINRILIKQDTLRRWTTLLAVRRHHCAFIRKSHFRAWRLYMYSLDKRLRVAQGIRRRVGALVYRKMRDHLLLTMLAFKRWRDRDSSVHLWDFFKHGSLLARHSVYGEKAEGNIAGGVTGTVNAHKIAAVASLRASTQQHKLSVKMYEQLAHSQAGHMLIQDLEVSRQQAARASPRMRAAPNARVLELQANLQRRFSGVEDAHLQVERVMGRVGRPPALHIPTTPAANGTPVNSRNSRSHSPTHQPRVHATTTSPSHQHVRAVSAEPTGRGLHIRDLTQTVVQKPAKGIFFKR